MQISPISLYSMRNNNVQNVKSNKPSFGSGYSMVHGFDADTYVWGRVRVNYGNVQLRTYDTSALDRITKKISDLKDTEKRDFLLNAKEEETIGKVFRHISYTLKNAQKDDNSKEQFKAVFDEALNAKTRKESKKDIAANNANLIEWFIDCLPENSREDYLAKQEKFIAQARQDLKQPTWEPNPEAKIINL